MIDFRLIDHGSVVVLNAESAPAKAWVAEHLAHPETQTWGPNGTVVEPRFLPAILEGIAAEGLEVQA